MNWLNLAQDGAFNEISRHRAQRKQNVADEVGQILEQVRQNGDSALLELAQKANPSVTSILVTDAEQESASVTPEEQLAIQSLIDQTMKFNEIQLYYLTDNHEHSEVGPSRFPEVAKEVHDWWEDTLVGGSFGQRLIPLKSAGAVIPSGFPNRLHALASCICPANVAMVDNVSIALEPNRNGEVSPAELVLCKLCYAGQILKVSGPASIAALAYGTESVKKVNKIVGPGDAYINEAKRQVFGEVGVDSPSSLEEILILVDEETSPEDLLQYVNDALFMSKSAFVYLVFTSEKRLQAYNSAASLVNFQPENLLIAIAPSLEEVHTFINELAPSTVLLLGKTNQVAPLLTQAGAVFTGVPNLKAARLMSGASVFGASFGASAFSSPLSVADFFRLQTRVDWNKYDVEEAEKTLNVLEDLI